MTSGSTIPRTPDGVRGLIQRHLGMAERGLALVAEDLELGPGCKVEALARDAAGAPVLVFGAAPENGRTLSLRVLNAHAWYRSHGRFLVQEYADQGLHPAAPVRLLVLGLDFLADTLRDLQSLGLEGLQVHQLCSFTAGGKLRVGVTPLFGVEHAEVEAEGQNNMFQAPSGLPPGPAADHCRRFLDLVRRMDPRVTVCGDRFSRQIHLGGNRLAELYTADGTPRVWIQESGEHAIDSLQDCLAVVDRLVRQLLATEKLVAQKTVSSPGRAMPRLATTDHSAEARADPHAGSHEGLDEERFSLEPIRQTVVAAKVSRQEYSALEDAGAKGDEEGPLSPG